MAKKRRFSAKTEAAVMAPGWRRRASGAAPSRLLQTARSTTGPQRRRESRPRAASCPGTGTGSRSSRRAALRRGACSRTWARRRRPEGHAEMADLRCPSSSQGPRPRWWRLGLCPARGFLLSLAGLGSPPPFTELLALRAVRVSKTARPRHLPNPVGRVSVPREQLRSLDDEGSACDALGRSSFGQGRLLLVELAQ
jgi:hypothetical protein